MTLNQINALIEESKRTGRPIQMRSRINNRWDNIDFNEQIAFSSGDDYYRIAPPEPLKTREWWVRPMAKTCCHWDFVEGITVRSCDDKEKSAKEGWVLVREVME